MPMTMAMIVSSIVRARPCRTLLEKKNSLTTGQSNRGLVKMP